MESFEGVLRENPLADKKKVRVDYREVLSEVDFALFSRLRDARKQLAEKEAIPVYAIFSNEQLAAMATQHPQSLADLRKIDGVGARFQLPPAEGGNSY